MSVQVTPRVVSVLCLFVAVAGAGVARAAEIVPVPAGLAPGDTYRLVFVTAGLAPAATTDIGVYDSFVTAQATGSAVLDALGTTWRVLGSTAAVDAKTHTDTDPLTGGVAIYNLAGQLVAADNADLWDGMLANAITIDQNGSVVNQVVFTGTSPDGTAFAWQELGSDVSRVRYGQANLTGSGWTSIDWGGSLSSLHFYGISDVLTVVPEPSLMALLGAGALGFVRRRCGRAVR